MDIMQKNENYNKVISNIWETFLFTLEKTNDKFLAKGLTSIEYARVNYYVTSRKMI